MVRLEKIAYEKIFNNKLLGRARVLSAPRKNDPFTDLNLTEFPYSFGFKKYFNSLLWWLFKFEFTGAREVCANRGILMKDAWLEDEIKSRRCVLNEHIHRESMHPFTRELFFIRRMAIGKVEMGLSGFEAPDYYQEDNKKESYMDIEDFLDGHQHFLLSNYAAELTETTSMGNGSKVILEFLMINNLFARTAWSTYFFNENEYYNTRIKNKDIKEVFGQSLPDLDSEADKEALRMRLEKINAKVPGFIAPEGQKVNIDKIWNRLREKRDYWMAENGAFEVGDIDVNQYGQEKPFMVPHTQEPETLGKNNIGKVIPKFARKTPGGLMQ